MLAALLNIRAFAFVAVTVVATVAVGPAAFAASNVVPASSAGEGTGVVSGYTISAISYTLNGAISSDIDTVTFTATSDAGSLAAALTAMQVQFDSTAGFYTCTRVGGTPPAHDISCDTTAGVQLTVINTDVFHAVIVE